MIIRGDETTDVPTPSGPMRVHWFRPAIDGRFPGVLFYSEIYQVTAPIRRMAATVAGHGYVVGVPEVYHEYEPAGTVLGYDKPGTDRGNELKYKKPLAAYDADARAGFDALTGHAACTGRVGAMGVCLGGHLAFRAAFDRRAEAAACFYATDIHGGTLGARRQDDSLARIGDITGEVLFVWGRQDPHVPFTGRQTIRSGLEEAGTVYQWHEVNAPHAFLRDEGPRYDPALAFQCYGLALDLFGRRLRG